MIAAKYRLFSAEPKASMFRRYAHIEQVAVRQFDLGRHAMALFSELKLRVGLRRIRLRRLWNVSEQFYLAATAQNLKRLVRFLAQRESVPIPCST